MKSIAIKTNRNTYFVRYTINAHCEAEELLGFPITEIEGKTGFSVFRTILYIGLKYGGHRDMTLLKAGDIMQEIITDRGMEYLSEILSKAIQESISSEQDRQFKQNAAKKKN